MKTTLFFLEQSRYYVKTKETVESVFFAGAEAHLPQHLHLPIMY